MTRLLSERVIEEIGRARSLYHRLVLVVGGAGAGKTAALRDAADRTDAPLVNVNLELSLRLIDLTERQRALRVRPLLDRIIAERGSGVVLLDNLEMLFDATLRQHPLRLLQELSRNRVVAAAWNGSIEGGHVRHAAPGHPEHRRYPLDGVLAVDIGAAERAAPNPGGG